MEEIKLNNLDDIKKVILEFNTIPRQMRMMVSNRIVTKLNEMNEYVDVDSDNPILNYPSERFIVHDILADSFNEYEKYSDLLKSDKEIFNYRVFDELHDNLKDVKNIQNIINIADNKNTQADKLYVNEYPESKDFILILKMATNKLIKYFSCGSVENIFDSSLDDIEFIIASNILTESHIKRHLLPVMKCREISLFKNQLDERMNKRMDELFNSRISLVKQHVDEFMLFRNPNTASLEAYLKIQKMVYEEELVNGGIENDYVIDSVICKKNPKRLINLCESYSNKATTNLNQIDVFRLNKNGFNTTKSICVEGNVYNLYIKDNTQYMIMKSTKEDSLYYLIGESFKYKIKLNNKSKMKNETMDIIIESAFCNIIEKKNRR